MANRIFSTVILLLAFGSSCSAQIYGEEILHWDFANGIPATWTNESLSGIGLWEYRGPNTDPDISVCSQGSCGTQSVPPPSLTMTNGFVIFDSNYWDDNVGPCGQIGSGQDPGPHEARLTTNAVDLSGNDALVLTFQQQYKHYNHPNYDVYTFVEISVDGGNWVSILENPGDQAVSPVVEWATVNITDIVGNSNNVRFRFSFTGFYYWWAVDDIVIYSPNDNDLLLENPKYTQFNYNLPPQGFGDMEYNSYSTSMLPSFHFSGLTTNIGGNPQTNAKLQILIENEDSQAQIMTAQSSTQTVAPGAQTTFAVTNPYTPTSALGHYGIEFLVTQTQIDENLLNNFASKDYYIDEHTFARDENAMVDMFASNPLWQNDTVQVGNLFQTWTNGLKFHSISVALGDQTTIGAEIKGIVYNIDRDTIFGETETHVVNAANLNAIGGNNFVCLPLIEPIITTDTSLFLVMISHPGGPETQMRVGRSGTPPDFASLVGYPENNQLFYLLKTPMVRMHLFPGNSTPGCTDSEAMNFNPSASINDGCCMYPGCTNEAASNYDSTANFDDGSCAFFGCMDTEADNYNPLATEDDGSCEYWGCIDTQANNYESTANVDDGSCLYDNATMSVNVLTGCAPLTVAVNNQTAVVDDGVCLFELGDTSINEECDDFSYTYTEPGSYTITYTYTVGEFISETQIGQIVVYPIPEEPTAEYTMAGNLLSCDCGAEVSINWYLDGNLITGVDTSSFNPDENGVYWVEVVDENGCSAISNEVPVIIQSIEDKFNSGLFKLYPNPTNDWLAVVVDQPGFLFDFYDSQGKLVFSASHASATSQVVRFNVASGIYFARLQSGQHSETRIVVVSR